MKRLSLYILGIAAAVISFSSCAVRYTRPDIQTNHLFRDTTSIAMAVDSAFDITDVHWRDFYKDSILCALIDSALVRNFDLQVALKHIEQSASYFKQSQWAYVPTLGANASGSYSKSSPVSPETPYLSLGLSASWEIDIWGKLTKAKRAKYQQLLAQESTRNAIITQIVAEVARGYYMLISLDCQRKYVEETIVSREEYYRTVKSLKESAQVNEVAVLQAEAQLATAKGYIPTIDRAIRETENALCLLLGIPCGEITRASGIDLAAISFGDISTGVPAGILANRPDVMAAEHSLQAALHGYNSAVAAQYPSLTLSGNISSDAAQFDQWFAMPSSLVWGVLGSLFQPILNGRALKTQKEVAYKDYEIAEIEFRRAVINAGMEVSNALFAIQSDKELAKLQHQQFVALDKAYEYSLELMINGYATYLDVLTAQEGVFNAQIALINSTQAVVNDHIELYRTLGGGWKEPVSAEKINN